MKPKNWRCHKHPTKSKLNKHSYYTSLFKRLFFKHTVLAYSEKAENNFHKLDFRQTLKFTTNFRKDTVSQSMNTLVTS